MTELLNVGTDGYNYDHLSSETRDCIVNSRPRFAGDDWDDLGPLVRTAVAAANPSSPKVAQPMMKTAYEFFVWLRDDAAEDPVLEALTDRNIRLFIQQMPEMGQRKRDRVNFKLLSRLVEARTGNRPVGKTILRSDSAAYSDREIAELWSAAAAHRTPRMRDNARRLIAVGLSAGLTTAELATLRCGQIMNREIHLVDRIVPLLNPWSGDVDVDDRDSDEYYLLPGQARLAQPSHTVRGFLAELGVTRPTPQRLRATFITRLLESPLPATARLRVAGFKRYTGFDRYIATLPSVGAAEAAAIVREAVNGR
ncbi:hypothetical protein [Pseudolysinimonas sp.]